MTASLLKKARVLFEIPGVLANLLRIHMFRTADVPI